MEREPLRSEVIELYERMREVTFYPKDSTRSPEAQAGCPLPPREDEHGSPAIPVSSWTFKEIQRAEDILTDAQWPNFRDIYKHVKLGGHKLIPKEVLVSEARVLQLTLLVGMQRGRFDRLAKVLVTWRQV